ncbi:MAG: hypothetical protein J0L64_20090, partial [Acidobacteria bacterium]|nr:hypothetical protein [Acidobacteriota bacterium]
MAALVFVPASQADDADIPVAKYQLDHWDGADGFPEESIFALTQTGDGYLWVATPAGIVRYNGIEFTLIERSLLPGKAPWRDLRLTASPDGTLWLWNAYGQVWRMVKGRFDPIAGGEGDALGAVTWMGSGADGAMMLVSGGRLYMWKGGVIAPTVVSFAAWGDRLSGLYWSERSRKLWGRLTDGGLFRMTLEGKLE